MGYLSQMIEMYKVRLNELILAGLRALTGNKESYYENRVEDQMAAETPDTLPSNRAPANRSTKSRRLSSNRLGGYGKRKA